MIYFMRMIITSLIIFINCSFAYRSQSDLENQEIDEKGYLIRITSMYNGQTYLEYYYMDSSILYLDSVSMRSNDLDKSLTSNGAYLIVTDRGVQGSKKCCEIPNNQDQSSIENNQDLTIYKEALNRLMYFNKYDSELKYHSLMYKLSNSRGRIIISLIKLNIDYCLCAAKDAKNESELHIKKTNGLDNLSFTEVEYAFDFFSRIVPETFQFVRAIN